MYFAERLIILLGYCLYYDLINLRPQVEDMMRNKIQDESKLLIYA